MNRVVAWLAGVGLTPANTVRLEVRGRRTGRVRTFAVTTATRQGDRYLVSLAGEPNLERNLRAADGRAVRHVFEEAPPALLRDGDHLHLTHRRPRRARERQAQVFEMTREADLRWVGEPDGPGALSVGAAVLPDPLDLVAVVGEKMRDRVRLPLGAELRAATGSDHVRLDPLEETAGVGLCPGNHESGGKRRSGKARKGNALLRTALCEAAWSAARTRNTYLAAQFRRFARRFGKNGQSKAAFAVAHTLIVSIWHMLAQSVDYAELGADHFDRRIDIASHTHRLVRQLELLGHRVTLEPAA